MYDDIVHFLYDCRSTKDFWDQLEKWIFNITDVKIPLSKIDILFGIPSEDNGLLYCINFIILHAKWYIYHCKINDRCLFLLDFIGELKGHLLVEKCILNTNGQEDEFSRNWDLFHNALF